MTELTGVEESVRKLNEVMPTIPGDTYLNQDLPESDSGIEFEAGHIHGVLNDLSSGSGIQQQESVIISRRKLHFDYETIEYVSISLDSYELFLKNRLLRARAIDILVKEFRGRQPASVYDTSEMRTDPESVTAIRRNVLDARKVRSLIRKLVASGFDIQTDEQFGTLIELIDKLDPQHIRFNGLDERLHIESIDHSLYDEDGKKRTAILLQLNGAIHSDTTAEREQIVNIAELWLQEQTDIVFNPTVYSIPGKDVLILESSHAKWLIGFCIRHGIEIDSRYMQRTTQGINEQNFPVRINLPLDLILSQITRLATEKNYPEAVAFGRAIIDAAYNEFNNRFSTQVIAELLKEDSRFFDDLAEREGYERNLLIAYRIADLQRRLLVGILDALQLSGNLLEVDEELGADLSTYIRHVVQSEKIFLGDNTMSHLDQLKSHLTDRFKSNADRLLEMVASNPDLDHLIKTIEANQFSRVLPEQPITPEEIQRIQADLQLLNGDEVDSNSGDDTTKRN